MSTGVHDSGASHHLELMEMEESSHLFKNKTLLVALQSLSDSDKKGKERKRRRVKARTFLFPFPRFDLYSGPIPGDSPSKFAGWVSFYNFTSEDI